MVDVLKGNHCKKYPQKPELTVEKIGKQLRHSYKVKMASRAKGTNIQTEFQKNYQERRYLIIFNFYKSNNCFSFRVKASIQRTSLKGAAEEFQDLCKRDQTRDFWNALLLFISIFLMRLKISINSNEFNHLIL